MKKALSFLVILALVLTALPFACGESGPAASGWDTDEIGGVKNFDGWTTDSSGALRAVYSETAGNHRVWKPLLANQATFSASLRMTGSNQASGYVKVLGVSVELDGRGGTGQQEYVKINGSGKDWLNCADAAVTVQLARENGGNITVTLTGDGNDTPVSFTAIPSEANENLELGLYAGTVTFSDISVACGSGTVTAPVYPVSLTDGLFSYNASAGWVSGGTGWTTGSNSAEGLWVQSSSADGASAQAAYIAEKLSGSWYANVCITPLSTENNGRAVSKLQLLDQYKNPKVIFTLEQMTATKKVKFKLQALDPATNNWADLWSVDAWTKREDSSYNVRLALQPEGTLAMTVTGDKGYLVSETFNLPESTAELLNCAGVFTEKTETRFGNFFVGADNAASDYLTEARTAAANIAKNFVSGDRLTFVTFGYPDGTVTNTGYNVRVRNAGDVWEGTILLSAIDTLAQNPGATEEEKAALTQCIANTVNAYVNTYSETQCVTPGTAPMNHAMDDCGWNVYCFLLGCRYNTLLGQTEEAAKCLDYAKKLFNNTYDHYYDESLGGGMWYNNRKESKSLYACTLALTGYDLYEITGEETFRTRYLNIYNGIENNLARDDGLYWIEMNADGIVGASNPYDISEGGSCTYLGGNMCMAVLNARLGNYEKTLRTALGMTRYETDRTGAWLNDRDAWNNTFFLGLFVREAVNAGYADGSTVRTLQQTVRQILKNCVFEDGYYSASWQGPKEPYSWGYPSGRDGVYYDGARNRWGTQNNENNAYIGSTPNQLMTSATTAHVLFAAAALNAPQNAAELKELSVDNAVVWPAANGAILSYELEEYRKDTSVVRLRVSDGSSAAVNGDPVSGGTVLVSDPVAEIVVTSADGTVTNTYTLRLREDDCLHPETELRNAVPAGCVTPGYSGDTVCVACGETVSFGSETVPLGHDYQGTDVVAATCTGSGIRSLVCSRCNDRTSEIFPALGHNWSCGVCLTCGEKQNVFTDVPQKAWYFGAVYEAFRLGLMSGTGDALFEPLQTSSRAMVVSVLYRLEGAPDVGVAENPFRDVKAGKWYTDAVLWAGSRGIVAGYSDGRFGINDAITREQLVAILYRYASYKGLDVSARADITGYPDFSRVSSYARENVSWAVAAGIISGKAQNGKTVLDPRGNATRAELASIFVRYFTDYINIQ